MPSIRRRHTPDRYERFRRVQNGGIPGQIGAKVQYGQDYLVLNDSFKTDALYDPHDTYEFDACLDRQVSYDMLGVIYLKAKPEMRATTACRLVSTCG
jgi:hypothetical protein